MFRHLRAGAAEEIFGVQQIIDSAGKIPAVGFFQLRIVLETQYKAATKFSPFSQHTRQTRQFMQRRDLVVQEPDTASAARLQRQKIGRGHPQPHGNQRLQGLVIALVRSDKKPRWAWLVGVLVHPLPDGEPGPVRPFGSLQITHRLHVVGQHAPDGDRRFFDTAVDQRGSRRPFQENTELVEPHT